VSLEEQSLDPVIERTCAECGATLTKEEIQASLDAGGPYLCSVHAAEEVPLEDEEEGPTPG
jgi:hypothetical protein